MQAWFVMNHERLGIKIHQRQNEDGSITEELPMEAVGGAAVVPVLRLKHADAKSHLWREFGSIALGNEVLLYNHEIDMQVINNRLEFLEEKLDTMAEKEKAQTDMISKQSEQIAKLLSLVEKQQNN